MKGSWWFRFTLFATVIVFSVLMIVPTFVKIPEKSWYPFKSRVNLGLDLQGGIYLVLGIDFKKVYRDEIKQYARKFEYLVKDLGVHLEMGELDDKNPLDPMHSVKVDSAENIEKVKNKIKEYFGPQVRLTGESGTTLTYALASTLKNQIESQSVSKSIEVIRNRIDEFGVTEPEITSQGNDRMVVQLPGIKDIDRAKELIGKTAKLEFKLVNDRIGMGTLKSWVDKAKANGIVFKKGNSLTEYLRNINDFLKNEIPSGAELAFKRMSQHAHGDDDEMLVPYLVESVALLSGDDLEDAAMRIDQQENTPVVSLSFKAAGSKKFEEVTGKNAGRRLAIILDGNVYTDPYIQGKIAGGHAQITLGHGTYENQLKQAKDIALVLRAGALPVQLEFEEQRIVGPSLGGDSIKETAVASVVGVLLVFTFALIYYRMSGAVAVFTLICNVLIILAAAIFIEATLTLPGIAGIALTVGMAVDGNIIVYERIREEIRRGVRGMKAFERGFEHAFWTIVDANIATGMAVFCLLTFGTGPVRGFAVTTLIGIATTVYTCYFVSKLIFELLLTRRKNEEISI